MPQADINCYIVNVCRTCNDCKNTKTFLSSSFIAAPMIISLSEADLAHAGAETEKYEPVEASEAMQCITPYVTLDEDRIGEIHCRKEGHPTASAYSACCTGYIDMQNSYCSQTQENPNEKPEVDDELKEKPSKFIGDIQEKKPSPGEPGNNVRSPDPTLSQAFAVGEVCGGAPWNPQPEPPVASKYAGSGAVSRLPNNGYRQVPFYASGHSDGDYAKNTSAFGCNNGEPRTQGQVISANCHGHQSPEPNPEILPYPAPVWRWDGYVPVWHIAN